MPRTLGALLAVAIFATAGPVTAAPAADPKPADQTAQIQRLSLVVNELQRQRDEWVRKALDAAATPASVAAISQALDQDAVARANAAALKAAQPQPGH